MKKLLSFSFVAILLLLATTNGYSQLYSQANVVIRLSGSVPTASWINAGTPPFVSYAENAVGNGDHIVTMASNLSGARPVIIGRRSRGTLAVPTAVGNNDYLYSNLVSGFDGTAFQNPAAVDYFVDGTPSAGNVPARISFVTGTNGGNRLERLKVGSGGDFTFNATQMFLQKSTGRLGLGTLTPGGQLELSLDQGRKPSTSTWTITSDARLKTIDGAYTKGLQDILKLKTISYHYKNVGDRKFDEKTLAAQAVGFSAQDVQKVFPEAVGTDADGYLNLNIHPILIASINSIQELKTQIDAKDATISKQQAQLDKQQAQIDLLLQKFDQLDSRQQQCCNASSQTSRTINQNETVTAAETASLEQNAPNPVNNTTVIKYHLPSSVKEAQMMITDAKGTVIKTILLNAKANGQVTLTAGSLATGTYFYTLLTDGRKVASKEMQIIK